MSAPDKRMRRDLGALALTLVLALAALGAQRFFAEPGAWVRVEVNGEQYARWPLSTAVVQTVETAGGYNVIEIANNTVRIQDANCPDRLCVRQGAVSDAGGVIACVPHGLLIVVEGRDGGVDAVSQ